MLILKWFYQRLQAVDAYSLQLGNKISIKYFILLVYRTRLSFLLNSLNSFLRINGNSLKLQYCKLTLKQEIVSLNSIGKRFCFFTRDFARFTSFNVRTFGGKVFNRHIRNNFPSLIRFLIKSKKSFIKILIHLNKVKYLIKGNHLNPSQVILVFKRHKIYFKRAMK